MTQFAIKSEKLHPRDLIIYLFKRQISAFLIIFGRRGTGKTDYALHMAEILFKARVIQHFATNVKIYESKVPFVKITNLDDLKFWAKNEKGKKLFIFDEIGRSMPRRRPMSTLTVKLIMEFQILRKYKLSTISCTVNESLVDGSILGPDILDGYFNKPNFRNPKIALYVDMLEYFHKTILGIPRTNIKFDTWDSALFTEHGPLKAPAFKKKHLEQLWKWSHGATYKDLGIHNMQLHRILKKFVKETLERKLHDTQDIVSE